MEAPRIDELIAQVVAWHNRHGLARRIASTHVRSIGVVVLPFVSPVSATAKGSDKDLVPAFSEDFMAPLTPKQVARFAVRLGSREHPGAMSWAQRVVPVDPGHEASELVLLYLRTASIELGDHRCRVLIGSGPRPKIIGPRAWSPIRIAGASAAATAVMASGLMASILLGSPAQPDSLVAAVSPAASAPEHAVNLAKQAASAPFPASGAGLSSAPEAASAAAAHAIQAPLAAITASASMPVAGASSVARAASGVRTSIASIARPASAPAEASAPKPAVERTADADASHDRFRAPAIRPALSGEVRAAALLEGKRLRAMAPPGKEGAAVPGSGHVYAVMTISTRTRAVAERGHLVMDSSATAGELPGKPRSELMQVSGGWRAVLWPFSSRDDAKVAQAMLSERGVRTEVLEF